jgi:hypothetical protein
MLLDERAPNTCLEIETELIEEDLELRGMLRPPITNEQDPANFAGGSVYFEVKRNDAQSPQVEAQDVG